MDKDGWRPIETAPRDGTEFQAWGYMHDDGGPYHDNGQSFMGEMPRFVILRWCKDISGWVARDLGSFDGAIFWRPHQAPPMSGETMREAVARSLWFDFVDQQGYPNGLPTWGVITLTKHYTMDSANDLSQDKITPDMAEAGGWAVLFWETRSNEHRREVIASSIFAIMNAVKGHRLTAAQVRDQINSSTADPFFRRFAEGLAT